MSNKLKFGTKLHMHFGYDVWQAPQITQVLDICRLEPCTIVGYEKYFEAVKLICVEMTQTGISRVPTSGTRFGIEPYSWPSKFYDKRDAKNLWVNQWNPQARIDVAVRNLSDEGAVEAMGLLCKAQDFTYTGWNQLHKPKWKDITGDDFLWSNLDIFTRLMLGLDALGVKLVEGALQDYQSISTWQVTPSWVRNLWETSEMMRSLSQVEIVEGAFSA